MKIFLLIPLLISSLIAEKPSNVDSKEALRADPNDQEALYDLGLASYLDEEYPQAIEAWERLAKLAPDDWQLRAKLIQAYWAAGKQREADKAIKELRDARVTGKAQDLKDSKFFIRDQFVIGDVRVFTLEYFELEGERPLLWKFVMRSGDKTRDRHFSLGSYDSTTEAMRAMGDIGPKERAFHLDGYWDNGDHETFGFFKGRPDYETVRKQVAEILNGKRAPMSSTTRTRNGEQGGADQPATAPESKSEGKDKPQPESKPAPR